MSCTATLPRGAHALGAHASGALITGNNLPCLRLAWYCHLEPVREAGSILYCQFPLPAGAGESGGVSQCTAWPHPHPLTSITLVLHLKLPANHFRVTFRTTSDSLLRAWF